MIEFQLDGAVAVLTLNNPKNLNALGTEVISEICEKLEGVDEKANVLVLRGCERAFAAGVDITEIEKLSFQDAYLKNFINSDWEKIFNLRIPVISAVSGYALGGGFELTLMSDIVLASENAIFGFPEVNLGLMPGLGGTQLLSRLIGTKIASELILTGRFIKADEAHSLGIVSEIIANEKLMDRAMEVAQNIAKKSPASVRAIKEAIQMSQNSPLTQGIASERHMFRSLFSTDGKQKGIATFLKKRK